MTETIYRVHSTVNKQRTRLKRMKAVGPQKRVQRFVGGAIVVRKERAAYITETQLLDHLDAFKKAQEEGRLEVRTMTRQLVDLRTLEVSPLPTTPPQPIPVLDSAANDTQNVGERMPMYPGGKALGQEVPTPSVVKDLESESTSELTFDDPVFARKQARNKRIHGK